MRESIGMVPAVPAVSRPRASTKRSRAGQLFTFFTGMLLILVAAHLFGLSFNVTDSMPIGFYHVEPMSRPITKGVIAQVCLPDAVEAVGLRSGYLSEGPCPGHAIPILKILVATAGDRVTVRDDRVFVNGNPLPGSRTQTFDSHHHRLAHVARGTYVLGANQIWLWSPNPMSWDSRYYGPVREDGVVGRATLLLSFGKWPFATPEFLATKT